MPGLRFAKWVSSIASALVLVAAAPGAAAPAGSVPAVPWFDPAPCGFEAVADDWPAKNGLTCGWVTVQAHRDRPHSTTLRLWVFKMAAIGPTAGHPPLIRLVGGPEPAGVTPTSQRSPAHPLIVRLRANRDVIYFDYRGLGKSEPRLACNVAPVTGATLDARWRSKMAQHGECRRQIDAAGVDLSAVNAAEGAQDAEDIAHAMGYRTYDVWGSSYGAFPELYLVGHRPRGLRAAIVGVAFPPDTRNLEQFSTFAQGLTAMQRECDRSAPCHARFPDLAASLGRAMDRFNRETLTGRSRRLTAPDLFQSLFNMSADPDSLPFVPLGIAVAEKGDAQLVARWVDATKGDDLGIPDATDPQTPAAMATYCSALSGRGSIPQAVEAAGRRYPYLAKAIIPTNALDRLCTAWRTASPPRDPFEPIHGDIPVLFYYAQLDTAVVISDTLRVARGFPHATVVEAPGVGHVFSDDCLFDLYTAFLENPGSLLDLSCTARMKPISFPRDGFEAFVAAVSQPPRP
jgi:pimeloyl-ACP methyl ester carboxylesterase